jgi:hypothetical protein
MVLWRTSCEYWPDYRLIGQSDADIQAMWASDMMGDHMIEHCQSYLLLSVLMVSPLRAIGSILTR